MTTESDLDYNADVLYAEWRADQGAVSPRPLRAWIADHPNYANHLVEWAASSPVFDREPTTVHETARDYEIADRVISAMRVGYESPIRDLLDTARARGLSMLDLAKRLHLGAPIIAKLRQRLIDASTLPEALFSGLAHELRVSPDRMREYLIQPATLAPGAVYLADAAPEAADQEDWPTAISRCPGMTDMERAEWLADSQVGDGR